MARRMEPHDHADQEKGGFAADNETRIDVKRARATRSDERLTTSV